MSIIDKICCTCRITYYVWSAIRFRKSLQFDVLMAKEKIRKGKFVTEKKKAITDNIFKNTKNENIIPDFIKPKKLHGTFKKQWFWTKKNDKCRLH